MINKSWWLGVVAAGCACGVMAQDLGLDYGVATEVIKMSPAMAANAVRSSQQAVMEYQSAAMEQHLAQEALKRGLTARYDVERALRQAERQVLVQAVRDDVLRQVPAPTEKELKTFYDANTNRWVIPEGFQLDAVRLGQAEPARVDDVVQAIRQDTNWMATVVGMSSNILVISSGASGAWFASNQVEQTIWTALGKMKDGDIRDFNVNGATFVVRRSAYRPEGMATFEQALPDAVMMVRGMKEEKAWREFLDKQRTVLGF